MAGCAAAAWVWGDRQAQELAEWRRVWEGVYAGATGAEGTPEGASVEMLGRTVLREIESARQGGAELRTSVGELEAKLAKANAKGEAAAAELAKLKAGLAETEENLRAKYAGEMEAAKAEAAKAVAARNKALRDLESVKTQLDYAETTLNAIISTPGESMELAPEENPGGEETAGAEETEMENAGTGEEPGEPGDDGETVDSGNGGEPVAAGSAAESGEEGEAAEDAGKGEEAAKAPAEEEGAPEGKPAVVLEEEKRVMETFEVAEGGDGDDEAEGTTMPARPVGESKALLTLTYSEREGTLDVLFRDGGELTYSGVPPEVAAAIRDAGDGVDRAARTRLKGKYPVEGDEEAVWGKSGRGGRKGKDDGGAVAPVALWVTAD